jgi:hypothetical protein
MVLGNTKKKCIKPINRKTFKVRTGIINDTRILIQYISEHGYISKERHWAPNDILRDAKAYLNDEHYIDGLEYECIAKKQGLKKIPIETLIKLLKKAYTPKYLDRHSPPFSASPLCGYILYGNDRKLYKSVKHGASCKWIIYK